MTEDKKTLKEEIKYFRKLLRRCCKILMRLNAKGLLTQTDRIFIANNFIIDHEELWKKNIKK